MLIIEDSIVIITCIIVVLWLTVSHRQTQRALIWWNSRQSIRMCQEAETIRNGLLQESFILRRNLELLGANCLPNHHLQENYYLTTIEKFHHSLKELSDYLSPAYIDDSLPLAIRSILEMWKLRFPELNMDIELTSDLHDTSHQLNRVILTVLEELLQLTFLNVLTSPAMFVSLKSRGDSNQFIVSFSYNNVSKSSKSSHSVEFGYLRRMYKLLTFGECIYRLKDNTETWYFLWRNQQNTTKEEKNFLSLYKSP
jgi:hypothetical protein